MSVWQKPWNCFVCVKKVDLIRCQWKYFSICKKKNPLFCSFFFIVDDLCLWVIKETQMKAEQGCSSSKSYITIFRTCKKYWIHHTFWEYCYVIHMYFTQYEIVALFKSGISRIRYWSLVLCIWHYRKLFSLYGIIFQVPIWF